MDEQIGRLLDEPLVFDPHTPFAHAARAMPREYEIASWQAGRSFQEMIGEYMRGARRNPLTGRMYWVGPSGRVRNKEDAHGR